VFRQCLPFLNTIELCILTMVVTQMQRPWCRRHVLGLCIAVCVQMTVFFALYGLWRGNLWVLALRLNDVERGHGRNTPVGNRRAKRRDGDQHRGVRARSLELERDPRSTRRRLRTALGERTILHTATHA